MRGGEQRRGSIIFSELFWQSVARGRRMTDFPIRRGGGGGGEKWGLLHTTRKEESGQTAAAASVPPSFPLPSE